ncbi:MAG: DUF3817 domain-containing protein [Ornithinimicrobium sp.]|uniref:DUF3817 domain-containing protein n=1 Tax=Ornithinimicrobium sp. TaxID=1977084 RepID=UPI0026DF4F6A|nr:DUF3817 domain-containing protein [Ornithinimicrobium sp.]MDO5738859.1 DUF3817 domain-containing protein [Ornithinimicrobium sp.]
MTPRAKLTFFRTMAFVVGVGLLLLVTHMVLRYGFDNHALAWWPSPHGWVFMVYLIATALLGFELRWGMGKMVLVMLAGCVPLLSFWVEHKIATQAKAQIASINDAGKVTA